MSLAKGDRLEAALVGQQAVEITLQKHLGRNLVDIAATFAGGFSRFPQRTLRRHGRQALIPCPDFASDFRLQFVCEATRFVSRRTYPAVHVPRETDDDEFYWKDLIGLAVEDQAGTVLGEVSGLMETGANDVIVVRGGSGEILIPFLRHVVMAVDLERRRIVVDWQTNG